MQPRRGRAMHDTVETNAVVIGASAAGLAVAACLQEREVGFVVLEAAAQVAAPWRTHYVRLHLHTPKSGSWLPGLKFDRSLPKYPARDDVVTYLEDYARHHRIEPRFGQRVSRVERSDHGWITATGSHEYRSDNVVIATGYAHTPNVPVWPGVADYQGSVLHSSEYADGSRWEGQRVLVVGFGNSAGEIAIDLVEHGAETEMSVRGPVNVVPRDLAGIPVLSFGILGRRLPTRLSDAAFAPLLRRAVGDLTKAGLEPLPYGPMTQIHHHGSIPLLDVGTMDLIRRGVITVRRGINRFTRDGVAFVDGSVGAFSAVVLGTGYRPNLGAFLGRDIMRRALDEDGVPLRSGVPSPLPGLYFCGFYVSPSGMLREIRLEALAIAAVIAG